jgi:hypothetical protein
MTSMPEQERALFKPQQIDLPWGPVPSSVDVTVSDAERARALFDRDIAEYAGVLDAAQD